jgi:hypothetical protein
MRVGVIPSCVIFIILILDSVIRTAVCIQVELGVRVMVFNATFINISFISWWSVLLVEETRVFG